MPLSTSSNISALNALARKQAISANNIANSETREFKKSVAIIEEDLAGSLATKVQPVNTPGVMLNQPDGTTEELSNVDLGQELSGMIPTQRGYEANLKALQAIGEAEDELINLIG